MKSALVGVLILVVVLVALIFVEVSNQKPDQSALRLEFQKGREQGIQEMVGPFRSMKASFDSMEATNAKNERTLHSCMDGLRRSIGGR